MTMLPEFNQCGDLPIGGHSCTREELIARFVANDRRTWLWERFQPYLALARRCGFIRALIGGSFVTASSLRWPARKPNTGEFLQLSSGNLRFRRCAPIPD